MHPLLTRGWEALPKALQDMVATAVDSIRGVLIPAPPVFEQSSEVRLYIAPANYAGQGYRWARALERDARVSARNMVYAELNPFGYPVDYSVRGRTVTHSRRWQHALLQRLLADATHVLVEAEMPPLGGLWGQDVRRQIDALRAGGLVVGMVCHGSDIRLPSRHVSLEPWSPFADDGWVRVSDVEKVASDNRALLDDLALPTFVSTPGLLLDVPYAQLLPIVIETDRWRTSEPVLHRRRPRVLHVPSNPLVKGTAEIDPIMRRLHEEGVIDYVRLTGRTNAEMPGLIAQGDVVLDQFRLGDYGVGATEAMVAGRLVISHVSDQVRREVHARTGHDLPILESNIGSLDAVLRDVAEFPDRYRRIAAMGPQFATDVHNGDLSRRVLEHHLLERVT